MERAKQVAFSMKSVHNLPERSKEWCEKILRVKPWFFHPPKSLVSKSTSKSLVRHIDKYASLISHSLGQLGIGHSVNAVVVPNVYTVSCLINADREASPTKNTRKELAKTNGKVIVDVLGPSDVVAPLGTRWTGSRVLKGIHLAQMEGTPVVTLRMIDVQKAIEENSLKPFIADRLAPHLEKARERVNFKKSVQPNDDQRGASDLIDDLLIGHTR
jgi:hypothetical protein